MKTLLITLTLSLSVCISFAQTSVWKISKDGKELYLGGSVHVLRQSDYPLPNEFDSVFNKSELVVFETDIQAIENPQFGMELMQQAMLKGDTTLKDVLSEKMYNELKQESAKLSIPIEGLAKFKPSMVILTLTTLKMKKLGISAEGVDKHYFSKALKNNKETGYLETADEQADILVNMGEGNEDEFVKHSLKDLQRLDKELSTLIASWKDGSSKLMEKQIKEMKADTPKFYNSLLVERNNDWLPKIEAFLTDDTVEFVIVGTLHMYGSDGLLKLLEEKGYTVEQYTLDKKK